MHPGPMNRGVEIDPLIADGVQSVIREQVEMGVAVRMAVLEALGSTSAAGRRASWHERADPLRECPRGRSLARPRRAGARCWSPTAGSSPPARRRRTRARRKAAEIVDCRGAAIMPGLVDMRVFVGEPGGEHRETLETASRAAAAGGVTTIVTMPDTDPVIDDPALVDFMLRRARDTAVVRVHPMAAMTRGLAGEELAEFGLLQEAGAVAFTQGRRSLRNAKVMRNALTYARDFDALIVHHVEDPDLARAGVMNEGETATRLGLPGIPREAETIMLDRDIRSRGLTGGRYHAAQISCEPAVSALRRAKVAGNGVTAGAAIAHLSLNENDIGAYRTFFKMSPPLRSEDDRRRWSRRSPTARSTSSARRTIRRTWRASASRSPRPPTARSGWRPCSPPRSASSIPATCRCFASSRR